MTKFKEWNKTLPLARELYESSHDPATTHREWAESFNKIGKINIVIMSYLNNL